MRVSFNPAEVGRVFLGLIVSSALLWLSEPAGAQSCLQLPRGAVGWWPGDDHAADLIGVNNGLLQNGAGFGDGMVGRAFSLDGTDDHVRILDSPDLDFGTGPFSVGLWARTSFVGGTASDFLLSKCSTGFDHQYTLLYDAVGDQRAGFQQGNGVNLNVTARSSSGIADGRFRHFVGVRKGTSLELYVDGVLDGTASTPSSFSATSANDVVIGGRRQNVNDPYFHGLIDEVLIFRRALTPCEIKVIHAAGAAGICKGDSDADSLLDYDDNCPTVSNAAQEDLDGDLAGDACDCAAADAGVFAAPGEIGLLHAGTGGDNNRLEWCTTEHGAGAATVYDVIRGAIDELPVGTGPAEGCVGSGLTAPMTTDPITPALGQGFWYLVRGRNACGIGTYGFRGDGGEHTTAACP